MSVQYSALTGMLRIGDCIINMAKVSLIRVEKVHVYDDDDSEDDYESSLVPQVCIYCKDNKLWYDMSYLPLITAALMEGSTFAPMLAPVPSEKN
jgi:hypothetical protein